MAAGQLANDACRHPTGMLLQSHYLIPILLWHNRCSSTPVPTARPYYKATIRASIFLGRGSGGAAGTKREVKHKQSLGAVFYTMR